MKKFTLILLLCQLCLSLRAINVVEIFPGVDLSGLDIKFHIGTAQSAQVRWVESGEWGWYYEFWMDASGIPNWSGGQSFFMGTSDVMVCDILSVAPEDGRSWIVHNETNSYARIIGCEWFGGGTSYSPLVTMASEFAALLQQGFTSFWIDVGPFGQPRIRGGDMPADFDVYIITVTANPNPIRSGVYSDLCDDGTPAKTWPEPAPLSKSKGRKHRK